MILTKQLSLLLETQFSLPIILKNISTQKGHSGIRNLMISMLEEIKEGFSFSQILKKYPFVFPNLYIRVIQAGEKTGCLKEAVSYLFTYLNDLYTLKQKLRNAVIYPVIILSFSLSIVGFLLAYTTPKIVAVYKEAQFHLPFLTVWILTLSQFVKRIGLIFIISMIILIFLIRFLIKKNATLQEALHEYFLRCPYVGKIIKKIESTRFLHTSALLISSRLPIVESLTHASKLIANQSFHVGIENALKEIKKGSEIHRAFNKTDYFSPLVINLIGSGETSGQLKEMLAHGAYIQQIEINQAVDLGIKLLEPLLILFIGIIIFVIVLGILLPILNVDELIDFTQ